MIDYLTSNTNTLVWFCFTVYAISAIFLLPDAIDFQFDNVETSYQKAVKFASRFALRIAFIFPIIFVLKNLVY